MKNIKRIFKAIFKCFTEGPTLYRVTSLIFLIARVALLPILLPNAFEPIVSFFLVQAHFPKWLYEILIRLILLVIDALFLSNFMYAISYITVGNFYKSGTVYEYGSASYFICYTVYNVILILLIRYFVWWVILLCMLGYVLVCAGLYVAAYFQRSLPDEWFGRLLLHIICFVVALVVIILIAVFIF